MIRRPPRSTQSRSSAASDVYKRQIQLPGQPLEIALLLLTEVHPVLVPVRRADRQLTLDKHARGLELRVCDHGPWDHHRAISVGLTREGDPGSIVLRPHTERLLVALDVDPVAVHGNIPTTRVKGSACVTSGSPSSRSRRLIDSACSLMRRVPVQAQAVATNARWGRSAMISVSALSLIHI